MLTANAAGMKFRVQSLKHIINNPKNRHIYTTRNAFPKNRKTPDGELADF